MENNGNRLNKFLNNYRSKNTKKTYKQGLQHFFDSVYGEEGSLEEKADRYFTEQRDVEEDIQTFLNNIKTVAPKSIKLRLASIKTFLLENDVELPQKFWRKLGRKIKGSRALTLDRVPSTEELRSIFCHMPIQGSALYQFLTSSGMRIGEALQIQLQDLKLDQTPTLIEIRGEYTKTGNSRHAFISKEATETLKQWLNVREKYLVSAIGKSHTYKKKQNDTRIFPFETTVAYCIWKKALINSKKDQKDNNTNRYKVHPHVLRKYFRTKLATLIPVDIVEALMGHEGYLTEVYRRYTLEDLAKYYLKGESALLVFTEAEDVTQLRKEIEERNNQLQSLANGLSLENLELKKRVTSLENKNLKVYDRMDILEKLLRKTIKDL